MAGQMRWSAPPIVERAPPPETARVGSRCQHEGARLRLGPGSGSGSVSCGSAAAVRGGPAERMLRRLPRVDSLVMCIASLRSRM